MKKILALVLVCMMALASVAALAEDFPNGTLTVATNVAFAPYEYYDDETGEATGIDIEIVKMICAELGYDIEVIDMDFGAVVTSVGTGTYDIGVGAITITEERKQQALFTDPYEVALQQIVVLKDSEITDLDALKAASNIVIGVQESTTGDFYATDVIAVDNGDEVQRFKTGPDAILALTSGSIDCVIIDNGPAQSFLAGDENLVMFASDSDSEEYGFCFALENTELYEKFNEILKAKKEDGTVDAIIAEFYGKMAAE